MYSFYVVLKYTLHWIVITFRDSGNVVRVGISSNFCTIATYEDTPFFCSSVFTYMILITWPAQ